MGSPLMRNFESVSAAIATYLCWGIMTACGGTQANHSDGVTTADPPHPSISISTPSAAVLGNSSVAFTASVIGTTDTTAQWLVNGTVGGNAEVGTISPTGIYKAPAAANTTVKITAVLQADPIEQSSMSIQIVSPLAVAGQIVFGFSLPVDAQTSSAVYSTGGTLVRTLWSNQPYAQGPHLAAWDGKDDFGNILPHDAYQVRVLYNNVKYDWGLIGDTSSSWQGPDNWDLQSELPLAMAFVGSRAFTANGYSEGRPNASYFDVSTPQQPNPLLNVGQCDLLRYVASDGTRLYFGNVGDGWSGSNAFVFAVDGETSNKYPFTAGTAISNCGQPIDGVIDLDPGASSHSGLSRVHMPTGLAVQTNGKILAVSHGSFSDGQIAVASEDRISLFDKRSGASLGDIGVNNPQQLAFSSDGALWAIAGSRVVHITSVGQRNIVSNATFDVSSPLAVAVDPNTQDVLIADGGNVQQIKRFSASGNLLSTYGDPGGYTDCDPTITNSRLYLDATAGPGAGNNQSPATWLSVQQDGSVWIGDLGNDRILHISNTGQYLEQISFLRFLYSVAADHADPSRVFADFLEFKIDYSKLLIPGDPDPSLGGNGSWSLVRNWSVCTPANYAPSFIAVHTYTNGRTYAELPNFNVRSSWTGGALPELVELPKSGPIRFSSITLQKDQLPVIMDTQGNLALWEPDTSASVRETAYKRTLLGYDEANFPMWGNFQPVASVQSSDGKYRNSIDPLPIGGWGMQEYPESTAGGFYVTYNTTTSLPGRDFHLGGVLAESSNWSWKASPGAQADFPDGKGTFTDLEAYGGHNGITALVEGSNVLEGYDGQYGTFSSQWMHWREDGLLIGQFGHPANGTAADGTLYPGAAGNIARMATVSVNGDAYLFASDESYHPGIHVWKISGLDTVQEVTGTTLLGGTVLLSVGP